LKRPYFGSDRWISLKSLQEFPDAVFRGVDVETPLGQVEVASLEISLRVSNGHSFGSDRWIALKSLQEFRDAVFLGVDVESPLGQVEVASLEIRLRV
jgi:hypothetical protein